MKGIISIVLLFWGFAAFSQAVIQFDSRVHDFGTIKEVNGAVAYDLNLLTGGVLRF